MVVGLKLNPQLSTKLVLVVRNARDSSIICTNATMIGEKTAPFGYASQTFTSVNDSFSLSCKGLFDGVNEGDISANLTVRAWAESYGPSDTQATANISVENFVLDRCCLDAMDAPDGTVPIFRWYSPDRNDNMLSTTRGGCQGSILGPDYVFVRKEGYIFDPSLPMPVETIPLYSWYSNGRGDNLVTTSQAENGRRELGLSPDYEPPKLLGYIYPATYTGPDRDSSMTLLYRWYSLDRGDNLTTTSQSYHGL